MLNPRSLAAILVLTGLFPASPAAAAPAVDVTVPIVYGYKAEGLYHGNWALADLRPLFEAPDDGPSGRGYQLDSGALRHRRWHLWSASAPLTVAEARRAFAGKGVTLVGGPTAIRAVWTDGLQAFEAPGPAPAWVADWLAGQVGEHAHARLKTAALWAARGADGRALWLYAEDGAPPPIPALNDAEAWQWEAVAHGRASRDGRETTFHAVPRTFGGVALHALAARWRAEGNALRVDAGNLVDDATSPDAELALPDTLDAVGRMGLDALVPFDFELRLRHAEQVRLAASVPLVAANLKGPDDVPVSPWVVKERHGKRIAIIGLVDAEHVKRYSLYAGDGGWVTEDPFTALSRALREVKQQRPDAVVVVTNLREDELPRLRDEAEGVTAIVTRYQTRGEWDYRERFETGPRDARQALLPWVMAGGSKDQLGRLTLGFGERDGRAGLRWIENEVKRAIADQEVDPSPARTWAFAERLAAFQARRQDAVLPDRRRLAALDPRLARPDGRPAPQYDRVAWSRIAAGALKRATGVEVALLHVVRNAPIADGEVPRHVADSWLKRERVVLVQMSGGQIKRLLARDGAKSPFVTAGYHPEAGVIGGRELDETEHYRVATTESIARSEHADEDFEGPVDAELKRVGDRIVRGGSGVGIGDATLGVLDALRDRHGGFDDAYLQDLAALMLDDGQAFDSRWRVLVRHNELTYQHFQASPRDTFDKVRNAEINNPDSAFYGAKADVAAIHEAEAIEWENRGILRYVRADVVEAEPDPNAEPDAAEQDDLVQLTSELRVKAAALPSGFAEVPLVPYLSGNYLTEFTPSIDENGDFNPRRQELNAHTGLVVRPDAWLKELRVGLIGKNDLASPVGRFEPGFQVLALAEQPIGPATLAVSADARHFLGMPEDGPEDLAWLNKLSVALRFPLGGGLNLAVGTDALLFFGKLPETATWGNAITPTIGITYNGVWKPRYGVLYDPGDREEEE